MTRRTPTLALALVAGLAVAAPLAASAGEQISTSAGDGTAGVLGAPAAIAPLPAGGYLVADTANNRIRQVAADGTITTVAGTGVSGFTGDTGPAVAARLAAPAGVLALPGGGFLVADTANNRIRQVSAGGVITTVAGDGSACANPAATSCGDGPTPATAQLTAPRGLALRAGGSVLVADSGDQKIRELKLAPTPGILTAAGSGVACAVGTLPCTGAPGVANLNAPTDVSEVSGTSFLVADTGTSTVRLITAGSSDPVAGALLSDGVTPDGQAAAGSKVRAPTGVLATGGTTFAFAESGNAKLRQVDAGGLLTTRAGTGVAGFSGDGGDPAAAQLSTPLDVSTDAAGTGLLIADSGNDRVRLVSPAGGGGGGGAGAGAGTTATSATTSTGGGGDGTDPTATTPTTPPAAPPAPTLDVALLAAPASGRALVRLPGSSRYVALPELRRIPVGAEIDATDAVVRLVSELPGGGRGSAEVSAGRFRVFQRRDGLVDLRLSGPITGCPKAGRDPGSDGAQARGARATKPPPPRIRRIKVKASGPFRTDGRYGSAIVRGTRWITTDICRPGDSGTRVTVREGLVAVRDYHRRRTTLVPAGRSTTARAS